MIFILRKISVMGGKNSISWYGPWKVGLNGLQKIYLRLINSGNLFLEHLTFENTVKSRIWNAIYLISI